jgi:hypothetical protein
MVDTTASTPHETFWDREVVQPTHISWLEPIAVRHYVNQSISGDLGVWPLQWFQRLYPGPYSRALSVGCGGGPLERSLLSLNLCESIDAFDGSIRSLAVASQEARSIAGHRIRYFAADFNRPAIAPPPPWVRRRLFSPISTPCRKAGAPFLEHPDRAEIRRDRILRGVRRPLTT